ncbi:hypothetical protein C0991_003074 [Blastosporella zonata]|nr:hypothetical protein C0991_003074 [Blastosporella zonata]
MSAKGSVHSGSRSYKPSGARPARTDHSRQLAEHSKRDPESSESSKRDTEFHLHYYQSSLADGRADETDRDSSSSRLTRQISSGSTSPSDYSDSQTTDLSTTAPLSITSKPTRRSKAPSNGGSDRRRLAIVQMDSLDDSPPKKLRKGHDTQSTTIRTRRGVASDLAGLALVAPPDAAPKTYSHLTPPTTAPPTADATTRNAERSKSPHKITSDVTHITNNSGGESGSTDETHRTPSHHEPRVIIDTNALAAPGDQHNRASRTPSPGGVSGASDHVHELLSAQGPGMARGGTPNSFITTPEIGEAKDISTRVAAPIVVSLNSAGPFRRKEDTSIVNDSVQHPISALPFPSQDKSTYRHYEPGMDATAGPLPTLPPPRAMFNIDVNSPAPPRPPRLNSPFSRTRGDIEAVKQALQLPPSVTAALASRAPRSNTHDYAESPETKAALLDKSSEAETSYLSTNPSELRPVKSVHRREGAFGPPPSTSTMSSSVSDTSASHMIPTPDVVDRPHGDIKTTDNIKSANDQTSDGDVPPITVIQPMQLIQEDQEDNDVFTDLISSRPSTGRRTSDELSTRSSSQSPSYLDHSGDTPSPPPKSFRNSLTSNIKRLSSSLPRSPSLSSKSRRSSSGTYYSSRTPSPSMHIIPLPPTRPKIISTYPPAMFYNDVTARKTSHERCTLYAHKINELYMYDTGLGDWTIETKLQGTFDSYFASCLSLINLTENNNRPTVAFSAHTFTPQPRHTSRSSMISEVTFPRRPDASTATDLTVKTHDLTPAPPPVLPYPSLANQRIYPARSSSIISNTPPNSIRSFAPSTPNSSKSGFFASLGRKASMSSKKPGLPQISTTSPARVLTKNPPASAAPRAINISNSPVVPGGPRAIPNHRVARSQTYMPTTNSFSSNAPTADALGRRPSLFDLSLSPEPPVIDIAADPEFVRQVDKLVHLLPDADRDVLAGYLRRAGQDILAIGQYLEDEKNGTIKPP